MAMVSRGVVTASFRLQDEAAAVAAFVERYRRDLADACLVRLTEIHEDCVVLTVDSEFRTVYRRLGRKVIPTRMPGDRAPVASAPRRR
jgi:rRNA-processing protein FCF1